MYQAETVDGRLGLSPLPGRSVRDPPKHNVLADMSGDENRVEWRRGRWRKVEPRWRCDPVAKADPGASRMSECCHLRGRRARIGNLLVPPHLAPTTAKTRGEGGRRCTWSMSGVVGSTYTRRRSWRVCCSRAPTERSSARCARSKQVHSPQERRRIRPRAKVA